MSPGGGNDRGNDGVMTPSCIDVPAADADVCACEGAAATGVGGDGGTIGLGKIAAVVVATVFGSSSAIMDRATDM